MINMMAIDKNTVAVSFIKMKDVSLKTEECYE